METAYKMIQAAVDAGCDVVKFQLLDMDEVARDDPEYEWFASLELDEARIASLIECARKLKIDILFTPVSVKTAQWIYNAGLKNVKIASSFINKTELLDYISMHFKKVYVSTGMAGLDEIVSVVEKLSNIDEIILMHCISEYPTGPLLEKRGLCALKEEDAHLEMMRIIKSIFPNKRVGYSDHTDGIFVPVTSVAMGAEIVKKHITLDRETPINHFKNHLKYMGTDHILSIEPSLLNEMVSKIRRVEKIRGEYEWKRTDGEIILREFLRGRYSEENKQ